MAFEGKRLRDLAEADIRQLVASGVAEHLYLEYKQQPYENNHAGKKEFLLDMCAFANAQGGLILIGIIEQRDDQGQPTGLPDPTAEIGVQMENPEAVLQAYDARVASCIEERLSIESHAIHVDGDRHVLVFRIPDSVAKPHCVNLENHTYFPKRRERSKYAMDVREIKDLAMRAASQMEKAEALIKSVGPWNVPRDASITIVMVPVFSRDFLVDIKNSAVHRALGELYGVVTRPDYTANGLSVTSARTKAELGRNGLLTYGRTSFAWSRAGETPYFHLTAIDQSLHHFVTHAQSVYAAASIPSPVLLTASLATSEGLFSVDAWGIAEAPGVRAGVLGFPILQVENVFDPPEKIIRPLCDVAHQMFGKRESPCFGADGNWIPPR